mmetsp:Transcript_68964/g.202458  ORF Transcript_68964/g.202458 Transcript_68964/m.202458 type:complete len:241 (+) Transcript_68964:202-924(+)
MVWDVLAILAGACGSSAILVLSHVTILHGLCGLLRHPGRDGRAAVQLVRVPPRLLFSTGRDISVIGPIDDLGGFPRPGLRGAHGPAVRREAASTGQLGGGQLLNLVGLVGRVGVGHNHVEALQHVVDVLLDLPAEERELGRQKLLGLSRVGLGLQLDSSLAVAGRHRLQGVELLDLRQVEERGRLLQTGLHDVLQRVLDLRHLLDLLLADLLNLHLEEHDLRADVRVGGLGETLGELLVA